MPLFGSSSTELDLYTQCEELKGLIRGHDLMLKDKELKHARAVETYESKINKLTEENKQLKEKYEKINEAQRKLEKLNSNLEDRLLKIVSKYESEQKNLLEELTLAHSKIVESNLKITELEKDKESYRQDCNLAVSLLQCRPNGFVSHAFNNLPVNLKERVRTCLVNDETAHLEISNETQKTPVVQLTPSPASTAHTSTQNSESTSSSSLSLNDIGRYNNGGLALNHEDTNFSSGMVPVNLLAQVLKKDSDSNAKKSFKFFPYICLRCKKELVVCDSPTQTDNEDLQNEGNRVLHGNPAGFSLVPRNAVCSNEQMARSKTVGNKLFELDSSQETAANQNQMLGVKSGQHHQKCASVDLSSMNRPAFNPVIPLLSSSNSGSRTRLNQSGRSEIQHI